ncbi:MAG: PKD domain-containing protein [Bacteroidota bacterium]
MERNEHDIFDQLVREKLSGYTEPPEPAWIKNIHAKKSRVINLYHLYRLMLITALVGAGIFASVQFVPYSNSIQSVSNQASESTLTSQSADKQPTNGMATGYSSDQANTIPVGSPLLNIFSTSGNQFNPESNNSPFRSGNNHTTKPGNVNIDNQLSKHPHQTTQPKPSPAGESYLIEAPKATDVEPQTKPIEQEESKDADGKDASSSCNASFEYFTSYTGEINFANTSSVSPNGTISWTFGDGLESDESEPVHQYKTTGNYEVTLYVKDNKTGCEDRISKNITYKNPNDKTTPITISGELYAGTTPVKNGRVELYQYDLKKGGFVLTNSFRTSQSGSYSVHINRNERYLLKGIPSDDMQDYLPAFWGNSEYIEDASEIVIMPSEKDNLIGYNIELALGEKQQADPDIKDPVASNTDQNVLLLDGNNNVIGVGTVDASGHYSFSGNIPPGDYKVLNPATGVTTAKTVPGGGNGTISGSIFDKGRSPASSGTEETVSVYPNPAGNTVNFGINSTTDENATIIIMNAAGVELSRKQVVITSGFNQTQYDLTHYSPGIYYVLVFKGTQQVLSNRLVKMADASK